MRGIDTSKSIEQLEQDYRGDAAPNSSPITSECHRLRQVPLRDLTTGDLLLLIRRDISLQRLVPLALSLVEANPLLEGRYYPADLTLALLRSESAFWKRHPEYSRRLIAVGRKAIDEAEAAKKAAGQSSYDMNSTEFTDMDLLASSYARFCKQYGPA